jgi:hypothetical protein
MYTQGYVIFHKEPNIKYRSGNTANSALEYAFLKLALPFDLPFNEDKYHSITKRLLATTKAAPNAVTAKPIAAASLGISSEVDGMISGPPRSHDAHPLSWSAHSTLTSGIAGVFHNHLNSRITVSLKPQARCTAPVLRGRLSGPALGTVDWGDPTKLATKGTQIEGSYSVPTGGSYFLEFFVLSCGAMDEQADIKNNCVAGSYSNSVSNLGESVDVLPPSQLGALGPLGRWVAKTELMAKMLRMYLCTHVLSP